MALARGWGCSRELQGEPGGAFFTVQSQAPQGPEIVGQAGVVLPAKHEHPAVHTAHGMAITRLGPDAIGFQLTPCGPAYIIFRVTAVPSPQCPQQSSETLSVCKACRQDSTGCWGKSCGCRAVNQAIAKPGKAMHGVQASWQQLTSWCQTAKRHPAGSLWCQDLHESGGDPHPKQQCRQSHVQRVARHLLVVLLGSIPSYPACITSTCKW